MNDESGIYRIDCNGECLYVGQSINLKNREKFHLRKLRKNSHYNLYLQRLYNKYSDNFVFSKIEECAPEKLTEREMFWIDKLHPKCNMQIPSDSTYFTITQESREKMSRISKSRMTPEMRKIISEKAREAMQRPDVRNNFINGQNNKKNKTPWNKGLKGLNSSRKKRVYCPDVGLFFNSATEAANYFKFSSVSNICRVCRGERNVYKGLRFQYVKE